MVYTRILFNNIKESTPNFFKTIPYNQTVKPVLGRQPQRGWKMMKDPKVIRGMLGIKRYIMGNTMNYHIFLFFLTYGVTTVFFAPALWAYRSTNAHRTLDVAIAKEKAYQARKAKEEEGDDDEEGEGEGEAEETAEGEEAAEGEKAEEAEEKTEEKADEAEEKSDEAEEKTEDANEGKEGNVSDKRDELAADVGEAKEDADQENQKEADDEE